ncbi:MAG: hypothetical protein ABWZ76_12810 [Acidimicrobiales bacterium]|jgi:hypothetical protein
MSTVRWKVDADASYVTHRLPGALLVGAGAALGSVAVSSLHRRPAETTATVPVVRATADAA